jgi:hypothetical protein
MLYLLSWSSTRAGSTTASGVGMHCSSNGKIQPLNVSKEVQSIFNVVMLRSPRFNSYDNAKQQQEGAGYGDGCFWLVAMAKQSINHSFIHSFIHSSDANYNY